MKRGDVVLLVMSGDYGKPRPAVVRRIIGHVNDATMREVDRALFVVLGLGRTRS